ncbi:MAG: protein-methionine-sulfoxide reductase heme-binding subunit MsrQ [Paracoccaceae bacterium]
MTFRPYLPWIDRADRVSALRIAAFALIVLPGCWIAFAFLSGRLMPESEKAATHLTGEWTLYLLLTALAVSPLRRLMGWSRLIGVRRMIGVAAFAYVAAHFGLYLLHINLDVAKAVSEIIARFYLTIGFITLVGLGALAATSFDRAIRRMGRGWRRLHKLAYPLTALGLWHYFLQSKIDVSAPALLAGIFAGLMLHRVLDRPSIRGRLAPEATTLAVAIASGFFAAGAEYFWHLFMTGLPADRVLMSNLDFSYEVRPPWIAAAIMAAPLAPLLSARVWRILKPRQAAPQSSA